MRLFIGILVGILVLFQYDLWFGKNGYFDYKDVAAQIKENKAENEKLSQRNQMISAEIQGLTKGFESIEERARMSHDMVNNSVYRLAGNLPTAHWTVRNPDSCIQESQVVVYLRNSSDSRPRILVSGLLVN